MDEKRKKIIRAILAELGEDQVFLANLIGKTSQSVSGEFESDTKVSGKLNGSGFSDVRITFIRHRVAR